MSAYENYKNVETFIVANFIANDQPAYTYWSLTAYQLLYAQAEPENALSQLAKQMQRELSKQLPIKYVGTWWGNLLESSLNEVDWDEVADDSIQVAKERRTTVLAESKL